MPRPSFPLTASPWIPVYDLEADTMREVGMAEALVRAHEVVLPVVSSLGLPVLRVLAAAYDAACGPRTLDEWDHAWHAPALDAEAITAYFARWEHRLDLFGPQLPAFQCGQLTDFNRDARALHPSTGGTDFFARLPSRTEDFTPGPAQAAMLLLHLLAYDIAGIRPAAPGDPAGRGGKSFGGQVSPLAAATHLHVTAGNSLKDLLMLNMPASPRVDGDGPVWERQEPPPRRDVRPAAGRMDLLTWPARRLRLRAADDGTITGLALYDGDRLPDGWVTTAAWDPMTAWTLNSKSRPAPYRHTSPSGWPGPWRAARLLDGGNPHSFALDHTLAVCSRGLLPAEEPVTVTLSWTDHTNVHRSTIKSIDVSSTELGTVGQLAHQENRAHLARMARAADDTTDMLVRAVHRVTKQPVDELRKRLDFTALEPAWPEAKDTTTDPDASFACWEAALDSAAQKALDSLHLPVHTRGAVERACRTPTSRMPKKGVELFDVFGARLSLSQISSHDRCVVTYAALRKRIADGWDVETAATTPARRGPSKRPS